MEQNEVYELILEQCERIGAICDAAAIAARASLEDYNNIAKRITPETVLNLMMIISDEVDTIRNNIYARPH